MRNVSVLVLVFFFSLSAAAREKSNIQVWGEVNVGDDGKGYLTMYKNCPAEVTVQFHFVYRDKSDSEIYELVMADTVAAVRDPVPVEKPVKEVVVDKAIYSSVRDNGEIYRTENPDDPILAMLLVDLFDLYHDIFWFDAMHRAHYYKDRRYENWNPVSGRSRQNRGQSTSPDIDLDKLDDTALLGGVAAVAVASAGMLVAVADRWNIKDGRFPYFSFSSQVQFYCETGNVRDVVEFRYRGGNSGGFSLMGDLGYCSGSLNRPDLFDRRFTWSVGAGLDLGAFSLQFHYKPSTGIHTENFMNVQLGYDIFVLKNLALDLRAGAGVFEYDGDLYADYPLSVGLLWKF